MTPLTAHSWKDRARSAAIACVLTLAGALVGIPSGMMGYGLIKTGGAEVSHIIVLLAALAIFLPVSAILGFARPDSNKVRWIALLLGISLSVLLLIIGAMISLLG